MRSPLPKTRLPHAARRIHQMESALTDSLTEGEGVRVSYPGWNRFSARGCRHGGTPLRCLVGAAGVDRRNDMAPLVGCLASRPSLACVADAARCPCGGPVRTAETRNGV